MMHQHHSQPPLLSHVHPSTLQSLPSAQHQHQSSSHNMNHVGQQQQIAPPSTQQPPPSHMTNINVSIPPPLAQSHRQNNIHPHHLHQQQQQQQQQHHHHQSQHRDQHNRVNIHQQRINPQMHQPPPTHHGRQNFHTNGPRLSSTSHHQPTPHKPHSNAAMPIMKILTSPHQTALQSNKPTHPIKVTSLPHTSIQQRTHALDDNLVQRTHNGTGKQPQTSTAAAAAVTQSQSTAVPSPSSQQQSTAAAPVVSAAAILSSCSSSTSSQSSTHHIDSSGVIEVSAVGGDPVLQSPAMGEVLSNGKEKTPMCLVNELARFNKIQHQYRLTGEQGPPHKKRFTVTLKLGEEEYTSDEASIKKAQHSAAATAIDQTKYKHPPAKISRLRPTSRNADDLGNITPTVELNALAMKRSETTTYHVVPPKALAHTNSQLPPEALPDGCFPTATYYGDYGPSAALNRYHAKWYNFGRSQMGGGGGGGGGSSSSGGGGGGPGGNGRGRNYSKIDYNRQHSNYNYPPAGTNDDPYTVTLEVGSRKFMGIGNTLQSARHDAASKALDVLKPITTDSDALENADDEHSDLKSPISVVHEMVLKRNLSVAFKVQSEKGPPHMKTFVTQCIVGNITTEGEGNGKKLSKKRSAESMLVELRKLPPTSPVHSVPGTTNTSAKGPKRKSQMIKKKTRNLIKENQTEEETDEINPISRLIHYAQSSKAKEPIYTMLDERGSPRHREFVMEVFAVNQKAQGAGSTKKLAKRQAAENLLTLLGVQRTQTAKVAANLPNGNDTMPTVSEPIVNGNEPTTDKSKKVTFTERGESAVATSTITHSNSAGRQLAPGLLLMNQGNMGYGASLKSNVKLQTGATIAKDIMIAGSSSTADAMVPSNVVNSKHTKHLTPTATVAATPSATSHVSLSGEAIRPKDQLLYLAALLGFKVQFSDFPKGNHGEFLTLVTMSTEPPQLCHGAGSSTETSHDQAANTALKMLSELGLDNVVPDKKATSLSNDNGQKIITNGGNQ